MRLWSKPWKKASKKRRRWSTAPNPQATALKKKWFEKPWLIELADKQLFAFAAGNKPVCREDGDMEVLREDLRKKEQELQQLVELHEI